MESIDEVENETIIVLEGTRGFGKIIELFNTKVVDSTAYCSDV
jgi:hypothetical protein